MKLKAGNKVVVAECYLTDEATEHINTSSIATVIGDATGDELVVIEYESGEIDFVPQDILEVVKKLPKNIVDYLNKNLSFNGYGLVNIARLKASTNSSIENEDLKRRIQAKFGHEMSNGKVEFIESTIPLSSERIAKL